MTEPATRLGPIALMPGVLPRHAGFYLFTAFAGVTLTTFVNVIQPYVLTVNLALPVEQQGQVSGDMVFYGEIVLLLLSSLVGVVSDRIGRRGVFAVGVMIIGAGYGLYGYVDSVTGLTAVRIFLAFGIAIINVMVGAIQADYPQEHSRGKLVGFTGFAIGVGAVLIGAVFSQLPYWYVDAGFGELTAGRYTMFTMVALAVILTLAIRFGLKGGRPVRTVKEQTLSQQFIRGLTAARQNRRIALAYACAFVSRGDLVVVGAFYTLWLNQAGIQSGMSPDEAARTAGGFFAMVMSAALLWAPIMGVLNDRMNRVQATALAMFLTGVGYLFMGLIPDPLGGWMIPAGILLGIGQMSAVTAGQTLIGQEAPAEIRGSVIGMFSFFGAAGIMFITSVGGRLYDAIGPASPFVLIGAINAVLFFVAFYMCRSQPGPDAESIEHEQT